MIASENFLEFCVQASLFILTISFILSVYRVIVGPILPDRILALDMLVSIAIGFIAVMGIKTRFELYVDIAIALGLVGFLATVAFARFIMQSDKTIVHDECGDTPPDSLTKAPLGSKEEQA